MQNKLLKDVYLIALMGVLMILMFSLIAPFVTTLLLAILLVAMFQPLHTKIAVATNKVTATTLSTLLVILIVVIPVAVMIGVVSSEVAVSSDKATDFINREIFAPNGEFKLLDRIVDFVRNFDPDFVIDIATVQNTLVTFVSSTGNFISTLLLGLVQNLGSIFIQIIVFLFALVLIFQDFDKLPNMIRRYSPLSDDLDRLLLEKFFSTGTAAIKGIFLVSLIHSLVITFIFYLFGVEGLGILFLLLFLAGIIPGGPQFVWIPVGILFGLTGGWPAAIALMIISFISMNLVDSVVRPALTGGGAEVHPLLSLISVLGGLVVYGLPGLLYGPLIAVLFVTVMGAYNKKFKS